MICTPRVKILHTFCKLLYTTYKHSQSTGTWSAVRWGLIDRWEEIQYGGQNRRSVYRVWHTMKFKQLWSWPSCHEVAWCSSWITSWKVMFRYSILGLNQDFYLTVNIVQILYSLHYKYIPLLELHIECSVFHLLTYSSV